MSDEGSAIPYSKGMAVVHYTAWQVEMITSIAELTGEVRSLSEGYKTLTNSMLPLTNDYQQRIGRDEITQWWLRVLSVAITAIGIVVAVKFH